MSKTRHRHFSPGVRAKLEALGYEPRDVGRVLAEARVDTKTTTDDGEHFTIPDTADGLAEVLGDQKKLKQVFAMDGGLEEFIDKYARLVARKHQDIQTQVDEQVQRTMAAWLKENRDEGVTPVNLDFSKPQGLAGLDRNTVEARQGLYNPRAMGAALDKEFKNSSDFFSLIWHNRQRDAQAQAQLGRIRNAFSSTVPSEGGFLIPENLRSELLRVALETSIVRPRARVIPMETLRVPFPAIDDTSHTSSVYGGIVGYWTEEGAALTASQASFSRIVLDAKKLTAYTEVPNELISDSVTSFQAFIDQIFPEALGFYEDVAFLTGTGVGEPLGVLNGSGVVTVTEATANKVTFPDIIKMYARMLPSSLSRAVWVASIDVMPELLSLVLTVAAGDSVSPPLWLTGGQTISAPPMTLLGRPVVFTEKVPALGTTGALSFIDFGFYLVGDRQVMSAMSSPHFKFQNDQTAYRIIERVDGRPWLNSAITPKNGSATLSPFVTLLSA